MVKDTHAWAQVTTTFSHPGFGDGLATMMFMLTPAVRSRLLSRACNRLLGIKDACQYIAIHPHEATLKTKSTYYALSIKAWHAELQDGSILSKRTVWKLRRPRVQGMQDYI
jgi:hypothetical protein